MTQPTQTNLKTIVKAESDLKQYDDAEKKYPLFTLKTLDAEFKKGTFLSTTIFEDNDGNYYCFRINEIGLLIWHKIVEGGSPWQQTPSLYTTLTTFKLIGKKI